MCDVWILFAKMSMDVACSSHTQPGLLLTAGLFAPHSVPVRHLITFSNFLTLSFIPFIIIPGKV